MDINELREQIDLIDSQLTTLFEERMRAAEAVADYKRERGLEIYDKRREDELIERNGKYIKDDSVRAYYVNFLEKTMEISRAYQSRLMEGMKIAYAGVEGAFAHIAASKLFPTAKKVGYGNFESAYAAVASGECDIAVLPIENSYNGEVGQVTDLIFSGTLYVNGMTELLITQDLLGVKGAATNDIKEVISHPQALGQCHEYIKEHGFREKEYTNTALAAKYVAEKGDKTIGAIASEAAAEIFGLDVLERNINASASNTTRFVILSRAENGSIPKRAKTTSLLFFTVRNEAGALAKAVDIIGTHGFNMRSLRSRPMKELLWQYYFYVELEGDLNTDEGRALLTDLTKYCDSVRARGTFIKN